jgi:immune inhibitor A
LFYRDVDASTVVPSEGNEQYSVRLVDSNGNPLPNLYGIDLELGNSITGSGDPADDGVAIGVSIQVLNAKKDRATVHVVPAP